MVLSYGQKKGIVNVAKKQDPEAFKRFMEDQGLDKDEVYQFGLLVKNDGYEGNDEDLKKMEEEDGIDLEMGRVGDIIADNAKYNMGGRRRRGRRTRKGGKKSRRSGRRTRRASRRSKR